MSGSLLKKARIIISLIFFLLTGFIFIDLFNTFSSGLVSTITYLQFLPSLIRFVHLLSFISAGFVIVTVLSFLFGRIYCSTICPLGTLQDIITWLGLKFSKRKRPFQHSSPFDRLRYGTMVITALFLAAGSVFLVDLLDPFSNFGRIANNLVRPVFLALNNLLAMVLAATGSYATAPVKWTGVSWLAFGFSSAWLALIFTLAWRRGRLYCNTVCPVGALLGLMANNSLYRIQLDRSACTLCGKCSAVCKAECIDFRKQEVDHSRCVGCMNCLIPCAENGVKILPFWKKENFSTAKYDPVRRKFLKETSLAATAVAGMGPVVLMAADDKKKEIIPGTVPIIREHPVTPPGSVSRKRFNSMCSACHLCISACPTHVLQPTYFHYGMAGFLQPRMDYITSFCNFECLICGEVCPTGAILPLLLEDKKLTQIGKSYFIKENCVVYTRETACGACSEHCPTKAVNMIPYKGKLTIPEVKNEICVGCGACEYACPTDPKSIYVEGNPGHERAKKPEVKEIQPDEDYKEDFPF